MNLESLWQTLGSLHGWEALAVTLGVAYLLLAVRESLWCWYAAFFSTAIYLWLFWQVQLPMESALQLYYLVMAVYGWYQWRHGGSQDSALGISTWGGRQHLLAIDLGHRAVHQGLAVYIALDVALPGQLTNQGYHPLSQRLALLPVLEIVVRALSLAFIHGLSTFLPGDEGIRRARIILPRPAEGKASRDYSRCRHSSPAAFPRRAIALQ